VIPFQWTREGLSAVAASLLVKFAAALLKWQEPVTATNDLLQHIVRSVRRIILNHRAPLPTP
jgi:hypothetical protein